MGRPKASGTIFTVQDQQRPQRDQEQFGIRAVHDAAWRPPHFQMKRVMVAAGRKGPLTPVPSWKLYENPFYELGILAAAQPEAAPSSGDLQASVSARKLAATLWGMQDFPLFSKSPRSVADATSRSSTSDSRVDTSVQLMLPPPSPSILYTPSKPEKMLLFHPSTKSSIDLDAKSLLTNKHLQRQSHVHRALERREDSQFSSTIGHHPSIGEVQNEKIVVRKTLEEGSRHGALESSVSTSHELYKVLGRIRNLEEQNNTSTSLAAALHLELDHARQHIQELKLQLKTARKEIDSLQRKSANERGQLRATEQERTKSTVKAIKQELEEEREKQRRLETTNKKLVNELADAKMALSKALEGVEEEKKARELMEDVCDELAREIGEDKAEFEELKRESSKVKEEVEEERKMLQVAEVWREERVQMKLAEARLELEEKTEALNKLRRELETFLDCRKSFDLESNSLQITQDIVKAEKLWEAVDALHLHDNGSTSFERETAGGALGLDMKNSSEVLKGPDSVQLSSNAITVMKESKGAGKPSKSKSKVKLLDRFRRHHNRDDGCKESEWKHEHENQQKETKTAIIPYADGFAKEKAKQVDYCTKEDGSANIVGLSEVVNRKFDDKTTDHSVTEPLKGGTNGYLGADQSSESSSKLWRSNSVGKQAICVLQRINNERMEIIPAVETRTSQIYSSSKSVESFAHHRIQANSLPVFQRGGWSSMDAANSQMIKGTKSSIEWPKNTRDNSLRAKLMEAKLEGQQGGLKAGRSIQ